MGHQQGFFITDERRYDDNGDGWVLEAVNMQCA